MKTYILKPRRSISTAKGIVGPPVDPENPTSKELITVKHFKNGEKGLLAVLASKNCPLQAFEKLEKKLEEKSENKPEDKKPQDEKANNLSGAKRK